MNKIILFFCVIFSISCGRQNYDLTILKISFGNNKYGPNEKLLFNISNPITRYHESRLISPIGNFEMTVNLPNDPSYIIYGMTVLLVDGSGQKIFSPNKYFFKEISLTNGGIQHVDIDIARDKILNEKFAKQDFINQENYSPNKILFRPCKDNNLTSNRCRIIEGSNDSSDFGTMLSMRVSFYLNQPGKPIFAEDLKYWQSDCIPITTSSNTFDPKIKLPISGHIPLNWPIKAEYFLDYYCHERFPLSYPNLSNFVSQTGFFSNLDLGLYLTPATLADGSDVTQFTFRQPKLESGLRCYNDISCLSEECIPDKNVCK